jgi:hypothetical protein
MISSAGVGNTFLPIVEVLLLRRMARLLSRLVSGKESSSLLLINAVCKGFEISWRWRLCAESCAGTTTGWCGRKDVQAEEQRCSVKVVVS